jgi:hypothetical protein
MRRHREAIGLRREFQGIRDAGAMMACPRFGIMTPRMRRSTYLDW